MPAPLPAFVPPMLAKLGKTPFDSDEYWFEIKWDGIRALAFAEGGDYRLHARSRRDLRPRYPELAPLADLPPGTVLDGELVVLRDGRPDFLSVMSREHARGTRRIESLTRTLPATYVVFDVLYRDHEPLVKLPLSARREHLTELVTGLGAERVVATDGVVGAGLLLFREATERDLEGIVAKRLASPYLPGQRTDAWTKLKKSHEALCVVLGFQEEAGEVRSLVIGAEVDGVLRCVGSVGSGLSRAMARRLGELLHARLAPRPLVECGFEATWVEPGLFCRVEYLEKTREGNLRAPVFVDLLADGA